MFTYIFLRAKVKWECSNLADLKCLPVLTSFEMENFKKRFFRAKRLTSMGLQKIGYANTVTLCLFFTVFFHSRCILVCDLLVL